MKTILFFLSAILLGILVYKANGPNPHLNLTKKQLITPKKSPPVEEVISDQDKLNLVENYLDQSGMAKNFSVPAIILEKHLKSPLLKTKFSMGDIEKLIQFFDTKLNPDTIENFVKDELYKKFEISELKELNQIYEQDLMKKLRSIEEYYSSDDAMEKAELFFQDNENLNNTKGRIKLLDQLITAQEADYTAKELTLESIKGLHRGLKRFLPEQKRVPDNKADLAIKIIENTPAANFKNTLLFRYQYLYQDLSEIELKNLIELSNNKLMRKARQASMAGIKLAFLTI
jgi:hypothetical protein